MKLVTYERATTTVTPARAAWVESDDLLVDIAAAYAWQCRATTTAASQEALSVWGDLSRIVGNWRDGDRWQRLRAMQDLWRTAYAGGDENAAACAVARSEARLCAPLRPNTFRDFYAFEEHVKTCRAKRGLEMVPEWYQFPVFYFSNPGSFRGPDQPIWAPPGCEELDYELEVACIIGQPGTDISVTDADRHIAGYAILNDWSARDLQRAEVKVGLGPAKGKDFATSFGPYFVTPDELSHAAEPTDKGLRHRLRMQAAVNGRVISAGNLHDLHFTFAQMIERASAGTSLFAGDVLGSGTVGTGCILELGTDVQPWLRPGDDLALAVDNLGVLRNPVVSRQSALTTERR